MNRPHQRRLRAAARQFVRKISGYRHPSKANLAVFEGAIQEISQSAQRLLDNLVVKRKLSAHEPRG